ncbi:AAA family ATPase [Maricaulis sp.]|uniref:AAA family ATPase n=1 Tax=Maricaulis sp. TaxID=1486257 RepID=UPI00329A3830
MKLKSLKILCREGNELVEFGEILTFIHGEMSTGKSTVVEMVDYCLGGQMAKTPAVSSEVISIQLLAQVGQTEILLERSIEEGTVIRATWEEEEGVRQASIPVKAGTEEVLEGGIYGFSDFLLTRMGLGVLKVRKSRLDPDSKYERLSFRDFFTFNYLDQFDLDSSLFELEQPIKKEKSKNVLNFVFGFQSDQLLVLEARLADLRQKQRSLREAAEEIDNFLASYGYNSESQISAQIDSVNAEAEQLELEREEQQKLGDIRKLVSDQDRALLLELDRSYFEKLEAVEDIKARISEQESLKAELLTLKLKAARTSSASEVLEKAKFLACPQCGTGVVEKLEPESCSLCKSDLSAEEHRTASRPSALIEQDLSDRIDDLKVSLKRLSASLRSQSDDLSLFMEKRLELRRALDAQRRESESEYISQARRLEARLGELNERRRHLVQIRKMPEEIERRLEAADKLSADIAQTLREIDAERSKFDSARANIGLLNKTLEDVLRSIRFPGFGADDRVYINVKSWFPYVFPNGDESRAWTFKDAGSGGKKTLFKMSYALSIYKVAKAKGLSFPNCFMIDSTMKNITPEINRDIFEHFYSELYGSLQDDLAGWQCIIVDQTLFPLEGAAPEFVERKFTVTDPAHPPLISYYRGH